MRGHLLAARKTRIAVWFVVALVAVVSAGCGGKKATVSGKVNYRGRALPSGSVTFFGADNQVVGNAAISDGSYTIKDVPAGSVKITVTTPPAIMADRRHPPPKDMPGGPTAPIVPIPPRYGNPEQSGLTYQVQAGSQEHPIDLN